MMHLQSKPRERIVGLEGIVHMPEFATEVHRTPKPQKIVTGEVNKGLSYVSGKSYQV